MGPSLSGPGCARAGFSARMLAGNRLVIAALLAWMSGTIQSGALHCPEGNVAVHAVDPCDEEIVCKGASDAIGFLRDAGLDVGAAIQIQVGEQLPELAGANAAGCYVRSDRCVYILAAATYQQQNAGRTGVMSLLTYRSLITHEVAHAIADENFAIPSPSIQAHEYIASVTMFSTMPDDLRARLLAALPGDGFDAEEQISATLYLLAPHWFAAQSYRHYKKEENGPSFLREVLAGRALFRQNGR